MPVNEFEKQVKQIMKGLKISPSEPSWENIEWQLRKKREKRRLIVFWFVFLFLVLGGGLWMIIGTGRGKSIVKVETDMTATRIEQTGTNNFRTDKKKEQINSRTTISNQEKISGAPDKKMVVNEAGGNSQPKQRLKDKNDRVTKPVLAKEKKSNDLNTENSTSEKKDQASINENKLPEKLEPADKNINDSISSTAKSNVEERNTDSVSGKDQVNNATNPENTAKKKTKSNKWQKVIGAEIGWSNYAEGIGGAKSLAYASNPSSTSGSPLSMPLNAPSPTTKGLSLTIGFGLSKAISQRFNLNIGLQYHHYSTNTTTGDKIEKDTIINNGADVIPISGYYINGTQNKYTSQFHVIEIPVSVDYRLFRNFPLELGAGVSYGRLINTNALAYNYQKNIYYKDPQSYTKNYFNIFSSLQYTWLQKKNLKIQSGPVILYNFSSLQREDNSIHLVSFGIRSNINFK